MFSLSMEMSRLTLDRTLPNPSRETKFSGANERGQGNIIFPCSADHVQDWQPYPVDPYSCYMCDHTSILCSADHEQDWQPYPVDPYSCLCHYYCCCILFILLILLMLLILSILLILFILLLLLILLIILILLVLNTINNIKYCMERTYVFLLDDD